jgi:redox-sensing transcriptional repressor
MAQPHAIPKAAVLRLSLYLREVTELQQKGVKTLSSSKLAALLGFTDAQVRKDLAYFGQFGHPGVGYHVVDLIRELKHILGTDRMWDVVLIGAGNLGRALAAYQGFQRQGFRIVGVFDASTEKVGMRVGDLAVQSMSDLAGAVGRTGARIAILCVPPDQAQRVADAAVAAGIRGLLNFAPASINVPEHVVENSVDLAIRLEQLSFQLRSATEKP